MFVLGKNGSLSAELRAELQDRLDVFNGKLTMVQFHAEDEGIESACRFYGALGLPPIEGKNPPAPDALAEILAGFNETDVEIDPESGFFAS